jgi:predicted DNA-binding ribbon-helix-helix protein
MMHVPTLNLNDSSLYLFSGLGDNTSPLLTRLTSAMASNMQILPMPAIGPNTAYNHSFTGPSLKCENATGIQKANISAVWAATESSMSDGNRIGKLTYLSFSSLFSDRDRLNISTFVDQCITGTTYTHTFCLPDTGPVLFMRIGSEYLTCTRQETLFKLHLRADGNIQVITDLQYEQYDLATDQMASNSTYALFSQALATILNGAIGAIGVGPAGHSMSSGSASPKTYNTRVMSTALIGAVSTASLGMEYRTPLREIPAADQQMAANKSIAAIVEELSRNQTLSLFSSQRLW